MKGKLVKQKDNWYVVRTEEGDWETFYPLCIDDVNEINAWEQIFDNIEARIATNQEVEFEIEDYWETGLEGPTKVARLGISSNVQSLDDKINAAAKQLFYDNSDSGWHAQFARDCFKEGVKWYREQLKQRQ
jgi:hypothetical protein